MLLGCELVRGDARDAGARAADLARGGARRLDRPALLWTEDLHEGAVALLFFWLPFGLLAALARPARRGTAAGCRSSASSWSGWRSRSRWIGVYQYATRDVFWNPKVIVGNAYAPFYRVNSVFYDPSVYGRFLVVAMLAALVIALYDRNRRTRIRAAARSW